jgi:hypothetical protein
LDEEGNFVVWDPKSPGTRRYNAETGEPFTAEDLIQEMISVRPGWLPSSTGGGAWHQGSAPGTNGFPRTRSAMTNEQKAAYIEKYGGESYLGLPV